MNGIEKNQTIKDVYRLMSELWCSPSETNVTDIKKDAKEVIKKLEYINKEAAILFRKFLEENTISDESYIDLFELDPRYRGHFGSNSNKSI